ncbi:NAD(P)H-binding protein [Streptomyces albus]
MKIVITTPTGHVGSRVVPLLLQAGVRPTLLARDPARLPAAVRERADVVRCDQGDGDAVVRATAGADALFWVNPPTDAEDPVEGYARMGAHAARAVRENGIARTVFLSSGGAELRSGAGEIDGLGRTEEMLDATGAHVLHLRCGSSTPICSSRWRRCVRKACCAPPCRSTTRCPGSIRATSETWWRPGCCPPTGRGGRPRGCTARRT